MGDKLETLDVSDCLVSLSLFQAKLERERQAQANGGAKPKPMKARLEKSASVAADILSERGVSDLSRPRSARALGEKKVCNT